jgi:hypothetical protein
VVNGLLQTNFEDIYAWAIALNGALLLVMPIMLPVRWHPY